MLVEINIAFLAAALCVLFGLTYTVGMFLDRATKRALQKRQNDEVVCEQAAVEA